MYATGYLFADDSNLFFTGIDPDLLESNINSEQDRETRNTMSFHITSRM